jgi:hypothetical protein
MVPRWIIEEGHDMRRALIVKLIVGAFALSATLAVPAFGEEPTSVPDPVADTPACPSANGLLVAAGSGCCQRQGGVCGCRGGGIRCCDGSASSCSCRDNSTPPEEL